METESSKECPTSETKEGSLTAAQRARLERNKSRALALREARLVKRPTSVICVFILYMKWKTLRSKVMFAYTYLY